MTAYKRGDIVLVPFPFSDQTAIKKRPAVVISSNHYHAASQDIIIMAITSQTEKSLALGESLITKWREAGLLKPSSIKPAISTIEQKLIMKKLGTLGVDDLASLNRILSELLDISPN